MRSRDSVDGASLPSILQSGIGGPAEWSHDDKEWCDCATHLQYNKPHRPGTYEVVPKSIHSAFVAIKIPPLAQYLRAHRLDYDWMEGRAIQKPEKHKARIVEEATGSDNALVLTNNTNPIDDSDLHDALIQALEASKSAIVQSRTALRAVSQIEQELFAAKTASEAADVRIMDLSQKLTQKMDFNIRAELLTRISVANDEVEAAAKVLMDAEGEYAAAEKQHDSAEARVKAAQAEVDECYKALRSARK